MIILAGSFIVDVWQNSKYASVIYNIWDKVFKNGLSKFCGRQPLNFPFKFFKACLPQNLLSPLLNTLSHIFILDTSKFNSVRNTEKYVYTDTCTW